MPDNVELRKRSWGRRILQGALVVIILILGVDYGKHMVLKGVLENEIAQSEGMVSVESLSISPWPLLENHLILKHFHVNVSGPPLAVREVIVRQGWRDWGIAHIQASDASIAKSVEIQEVRGILDTMDLGTRVKVSQLTLTDIRAKLPHITFSSPLASFDFLYEITTHNLSLKADVEKISFPNGATFGLNGQGLIHTKTPIRGKMDVKIRNIDTMMKELVAVGAVDPSQAGIVIAGSNLLGNIGLRDITFPLKIENGDVSLGPVTLFKIEE